MSIAQITSQPSIYIRKPSQSFHLSPKPFNLSINGKHSLRNPLVVNFNASIQQQHVPILKNQKFRAVPMRQQSLPVCSLGDKGQNGGDEEGSPWKALEKAVDNLKKKPSVEELLRQQIEKKEFAQDKDSGIRDGGDDGSRGGRGGNGGGGAEGSSGSEDGGIEEAIQVILATLGFVLLYLYIISGEEMTRLAKDYIKYLYSGSESARLKRIMYKWGKFRQKLTGKKKIREKDWLEKTIISTPTWFDSPEKYREMLRTLESNSDE